MPLPLLPLELQILILHHVGNQFAPFKEDSIKAKTLASCCLVCRAWFPVSQKYLLNRVNLNRYRLLKNLVSREFDPTEPMWSYPKQLNILPRIGFNERPFHHLVPYHTAGRFSCLVRLEFLGTEQGGNKEIFPITKQFPMHLSHFRHVISLQLQDFHFQTLWDLRRFIVALPVLSYLYLDSVTWAPFSDELGRVPSLPFIACKLRNINCWEMSALHEVLWFWVTSYRAPSLEHQRIAECHAEDRYPAFTIGDAAIIEKYIRELALPESQTVDFKWDYSSDHRCCKLHDLYPHTPSFLCGFFVLRQIQDCNSS